LWRQALRSTLHILASIRRIVPHHHVRNEDQEARVVQQVQPEPRVRKGLLGTMVPRVQQVPLDKTVQRVQPVPLD
jgi:hypothetical protein